MLHWTTGDCIECDRPVAFTGRSLMSDSVTYLRERGDPDERRTRSVGANREGR